MAKISIITDTDSSLPKEMAAKYDILQVPISIHMGDELTGTDHTIGNAELFAKIDQAGKLPTTAAPTPGQFLAYFKRVFDEQKPEILIYYAISGEMSATIKSAQIAADDMSDHDIRIIDTNTLSMAQGYMVLSAAEAAGHGKNVDEVMASAEEVQKNTILYGGLSTLKYLSMSGRVSHITAGMAGMLNIKPILSVQNGKLDMLEKVRTRKKSWARMIDLVKEDIGKGSIQRACVLHVNAQEAGEAFAGLLRDNLECPDDMPLIDVNPGLSVHTGAGLVGTCMVLKK